MRSCTRTEALAFIVGWVPRDWVEQVEDEALEKQSPVSPWSSDKQRDNGTYIVLCLGTAEGVLEVAKSTPSCRLVPRKSVGEGKSVWRV